ncbi:MAG: tRNA ligase subunit PheS family protein, partial [Microbacterium sp.]
MSEPTEITPEAVESAVVDALAAANAAADTAELKTARAAHQGETSPLAQFNAQMRSVPAERKAEFGKLVGGARSQVNRAFAAREEELARVELAARLEAERVDITAVASRGRTGARHPISVLQEQVGDIFVGMGWEIAEGPELEH